VPHRNPKTFSARFQLISETFPHFYGPAQDIRLHLAQIGHVGARRRGDYGEQAMGSIQLQPVVQTFTSVKDTRLTLERLKAFLFVLRKLALAQRMSAARAEIERGRERLWLGPGDGEKTHLNGAAHEDVARAGIGKSDPLPIPRRRIP
jgi:hypothetical protein